MNTNKERTSEVWLWVAVGLGSGLLAQFIESHEELAEEFLYFIAGSIGIKGGLLVALIGLPINAFFYLYFVRRMRSGPTSFLLKVLFLENVLLSVIIVKGAMP